MVNTKLNLICEMEMAYEAIQTLREIYDAAEDKSGLAFRELQQEIEELVYHKKQLTTLHNLSSGRLAAAPSEHVTLILKKARELDIIK